MLEDVEPLSILFSDNVNNEYANDCDTYVYTYVSRVDMTLCWIDWSSYNHTTLERVRCKLFNTKRVIYVHKNASGGPINFSHKC